MSKAPLGTTPRFSPRVTHASAAMIALATGIAMPDGLYVFRTTQHISTALLADEMQYHMGDPVLADLLGTEMNRRMAAPPTPEMAMAMSPAPPPRAPDVPAIPADELCPVHLHPGWVFVYNDRQPIHTIPLRVCPDDYRIRWIASSGLESHEKLPLRYHVDGEIRLLHFRPHSWWVTHAGDWATLMDADDERYDLEIPKIDLHGGTP